MSRLLIFISLALISLSGCSTIATAQIGEAAIIRSSKQKFVLGTDGVPLYPFFKEIKEKTLIFDTTDGKIININYHATGVNLNKVRNFYQDTLPQLGWSYQSTNSYMRDKEFLDFDISQSGRKQFLSFKITLSN